MTKAFDLTNHFSTTSAKEVNKLVAPLTATFNIKHFRYLKLYHDGSRVLLSNYPNCTRFMYEEGHYKKMWFDGEFPECLTDGWHFWDVLSMIENGREKDSFEKEINQLLDLYHGLTFVQQGLGFYEIYTFDSNTPAIYQVDKKLLLHFILYFRAQANKLIHVAENEKIYVPIKQSLLNQVKSQNDKRIIEFLNKTPINRFYLGGKYSHVYLTSKELQCVLWLTQGKSAEEIAIIEGNSAKTIESHLENVRKKLDCFKQTQLIRIVLESNVFHELWV